MRTKKISSFYIVLLILIAVTIIITEIGKGILKDYLEEYENSQYKYVAEDILDSNFNSGNASACAELFKSQISEYETEENIKSFFEKVIADNTFSLQSISSGLEEQIQYVIKNSDNLKYATFDIIKSGEKTTHGFDLYRPSNITFNEKLLKSYSIEIPVGYTLKVNGHDANEKYCLNDEIETDSQKFMPEGIKGIVYTTYSFSGMCSEPEFEVFSQSGDIAKVNAKNESLYRADLVYNEELANMYSEYVIEATKAYACYLQKDAYFGKVQKYLDPKSELYTNIKTSPNWMVISHDSYDFEDEKAFEFYEYTDGVISCRVTLAHILKRKGQDDYRDILDITWYLRDVDGKYLIYNSYTR